MIGEQAAKSVKQSCLWCKYYNKRGFCTDDYHGNLPLKYIERLVEMGERTLSEPPTKITCEDWVSKITLKPRR